MFEYDWAAVVQVNVGCRQLRVIVGRDLFIRSVIDAHNFYPLILEFELISLRSDFNRILSGCIEGKEKQNYE